MSTRRVRKEKRSIRNARPTWKTRASREMRARLNNVLKQRRLLVICSLVTLAVSVMIVGFGGIHPSTFLSGASRAGAPQSSLAPGSPSIEYIMVGGRMVASEQPAATGNPVPSISSISPPSVTAGGSAFTLTVNGSGFISSSVVRANGSNRTTSIVSATQVTAQILATDIAAAGSVSITVFNPTPGGGTSNTATLTVTSSNPVPAITNISPPSVAAGGDAFTLTVNGSGFISSSVVRANGSNRTTTFVNATQMTAQILASDITTAGSRSITVFNPSPGGGTSNTATLTVTSNNPVPSITSISPSSVAAGGATFTLTVNGSSFMSGSVVRVNGSNRTTAFVNVNQLTAQILASDIAAAGSRSITVFNPSPGGGTSNIATLTVTSNNPVPSITSISPSSVAAGGATFTITVNGSSFISGSVVRVDGSNRTTTFVNVNQLTAQILASDIATAGSRSITVFNPSPGGGTSNVVTLTVTSGGGVPAAPSNLTATVQSSSQIDLAWDDNSTNETGFKIMVSQNGGAWLVWDTIFSPDVGGYNAGGLNPGFTYCFTVRAFNAAGDSPDSNQVCATTPFGELTGSASLASGEGPDTPAGSTGIQWTWINGLNQVPPFVVYLAVLLSAVVFMWAGRERIRSLAIPAVRLAVSSGGRVVAVLVIMAMALPLTPTQAATIGEEAKRAVDTAVRFIHDVANPFARKSQTVQPQQTEDPRERGIKVTNISLCPRRLLMYVGEEHMLSPLPLDRDREPLHGVTFAWESSDPSIAEVASDGSVTALKAGTCKITASVETNGNKKAKVHVEVREGKRPFLKNEEWDREHGRDCDDPESDPAEAAEGSTADSNRSAARVGPSEAVTSAVLDNDDPPNVAGAADPINATGHPRFTPNLAAQGSSLGGDDQMGSLNFGFGVPIFGSSGRGVGIGLSLVYNSRLWTKDGNNIVFDYDQGWPAPGFRLNYGRIIPDYNAPTVDPPSHLLIEADGTRTPLIPTNSLRTLYRSNDGRAIEFDPAFSRLHTQDGTDIQYELNGSKLVPTFIRDVHGNSITITYVTSCSDALRVEPCTCGSGCVRPQRQAIKQISDTLGRFVTFHYFANGNLAEIRVPGYNGGASRTLVKFAYQPLTLAYNFGSMMVINAPGNSPVDVLRRVYFPDTGRGYIFDGYSSYGMFTHASMRLGMTATSEGTEVAYTEYRFPITGPLSDAPGYDQRSEWWLGKTDDFGNPVGPTSPAIYGYQRTTDSVAKTMTTSVTAPNGVRSEMVSNNDSASAQYGVVTTSKLLSPGSQILSQSDFVYSDRSSSSGLQRTRVTMTDDGSPANQTRVESFYDSTARVIESVEYGFPIAGVFKKRRRTVYTYLDDQAHIDAGVRQLVSDISVYDAKETNSNGDDTIIARRGFVYDTPDTGWEIVTYGFTKNCSPTSAPPCSPPPGFNTKFVDRTARGLVTKALLWSDATSPSAQITFRRQYDIFGNEVKAEVSCCSVKSFTFSSTMYYSAPLSATDGELGGVNMLTTLNYDFDTSFLNSQTDPQGLTTSYAPDAAMRLRTVTLPKLATDPNPPTVETFFPADPSFAGKDGLKYQSQITYMDGSTQRVQVSNQWFDGGGRAVRGGSGSGAVPTSFDAVKMIYDEMGRPLKTTNPYTTTDPNGDTVGLPNATTTDYDNLGRVVTVTLPDGNTVRSSYNGAEATATDQVGRQRRNRVDGLGRLVRVTEQNPANGTLEWVTNYTYDLLDNLVQVDQGGQLRAYKYDSLGRLLFERIPEQAATINDGTGTMWSCQYTYTTFGAVQTKKDPRGVVTNYGYDALNRLTSVAYNLASAPGVEPTTNVSINYNNPAGQTAGKGQVSFITDGAGREDFTYDVLGRLTSKMRTIDGVNQYTTGYEYNQASQLSVMVYPSNKRVRMNRDSRGRLSGLDKVDAGGGVLTSYLASLGYNAAGQVTGVTLGNGVTESYTYDAQRLQLTRQQATKGVTTLMDLNYSYQAQAGQNGAGTTAGNSGQLMKIVPGSTINGQARDQNFAYDNVGRLVTATGTGSGFGAWQRRYGYDRWGNRTGVWNAVSGGTQLQSVSIGQSGGAPTNRINTVSEGGGVSSYSHDAAGNVTNDGRHTYQYDAQNRIVSVDKSGSTSLATYTYDAGNRRVKKATGGVTTCYIWEGAQAIAEYSTAGASGGGGLKYYLADRLSTRLITDGSGNVLGTQDHLPFGEDAGVVGQFERHRFTTYERESETDLDYAVNRYYSPGSGRFMHVDPVDGDISDPQSFDRYVYVRNDPENAVDPLGLYWGYGPGDCMTGFIPGWSGLPLCLMGDPYSRGFRGRKIEREGGGGRRGQKGRLPRKGGRKTNADCKDIFERLQRAVEELSKRAFDLAIDRQDLWITGNVDALWSGNRQTHIDKFNETKKRVTDLLNDFNKGECGGRSGASNEQEVLGRANAQGLWEVPAPKNEVFRSLPEEPNFTWKKFWKQLREHLKWAEKNPWSMPIL
ncbi:MAG TPA: RHS repeat-associated core domain-containing protein [Blastocatellia bacterium]|nr:RHS repeat-associated core domain-containing protein [Blastocatellia bacterium]